MKTLNAGWFLVVLGLILFTDPDLLGQNTLNVNLSGVIRPVTHCASGSLYGVTETLPSDIANLVAPLKPNVFIQPALSGTGHQQPIGSAIPVSARLASTTAKVQIRLADVLPGWPYNWPGQASFLNTVTSVINSKKASGRNNYDGYEIWNEPNGTWQTANGDFYSVCWKPTYDLIRSLDPGAKIIGPSYSYYNSSQMKEFLTYCKNNNCLPEVISWHQWGAAGFSAAVDNYRALETSLGISPRKISINEYSSKTNDPLEGCPGVSVPLIAKFERKMVESACISWWFTNLPGRLGSLLTADNQKGGGWYLYKWYGDMTGNMVSVTPPNDNSDGIDGFACLDLDAKYASICVGGNYTGSTNVVVSGIPAVFGTKVNVKLECVTWTNKDTPVSGTNLISDSDFNVTNGSITVPVNISNPLYGYRVYITPGQTVMPVASITSEGPVTFCSGGSVLLNASTGIGYTYKWNKDGNNIANATASSYTATQSGSYTVTVSANGQTATSTAVSVTVNALPVITPYVQINGGAWLQQNTAQLCAGGTVVLGPQPLSATGWSWTGPDGFTASSRENSLTTISAAQGGVYTATYTSNGCMAKQTFNITVNSLPDAPTVSSPVAYCQNATATPLTAKGTSLKWYTLSGGGTSSATAPTPSTATAGTTNYYVSQTVNGCEGGRATIETTINSLPDAVITPSGPTTFNQGSSVVLRANTGTGLTYKWYNGTAYVGAGDTCKVTSGGNYTVEVTNASGCKATSSVVIVTVNVNQAPVVVIDTPSDYATFIAPAAVAIAATATDSDGTITKVEFYNGNTLLGSDASAPYGFTWSNVATGTYEITARATDNNGAVSASSIVTIKVNANQPSVIMITSPANNSTVSGHSVTINVTATDADGSITRVEYLDNGTVIGTSTTTPYSYTTGTLTPGSHEITVRVTDSNGGVTTSNPVIIKEDAIQTGIHPVSGMEISGNVYPNPSNGEMTIETVMDLTGVKVTLINVFGEAFQLQPAVNGKGTSIDVSGLAEGTYLLMLSKENLLLKKKIAIIK